MCLWERESVCDMCADVPTHTKARIHTQGVYLAEDNMKHESSSSVKFVDLIEFCAKSRFFLTSGASKEASWQGVKASRDAMSNVTHASRRGRGSKNTSRDASRTLRMVPKNPVAKPEGRK